MENTDDFDLVEWLSSFPRRPIDLWRVTIKYPDMDRMYWTGVDWTPVKDLAAVYAGVTVTIKVIESLQSASPKSMPLEVEGAGEREHTS